MDIILHLHIPVTTSPPAGEGNTGVPVGALIGGMIGITLLAAIVIIAIVLLMYMKMR